MSTPAPVDLAQLDRQVASAHQLDEFYDDGKPLVIGCASIEADTLATLVKCARALEFYADLDTYFAIGIVPDNPCGEFMDDIEAVDDDGYKTHRPGKRARAALANVIDTEPPPAKDGPS